MRIHYRSRRGNVSLLLLVKGKALGDMATVSADGLDSKVWCTFTPQALSVRGRA